jgi:hypothetical protein
MSKSKKSRPSSPSAELRELEEDESEREEEAEVDSEAEAESKKKSSKKKKSKSKSDDEPKPSKKASKKPSKKASKNAAKEEETDEAVKEDEDEDEDARDEDGFDIAQLREVAGEFRKRNKRAPIASDMAELLNVDKKSATKALASLKKSYFKTANERRRAKVSGYRRLAKEAGFADMKPTDDEVDDFINVSNSGIDVLQPLLSTSDGLRLATFVPMTPDATSFDEAEFKARLALSTTTLPESAARELVANAEAVFRGVVNGAVALTMTQRGTQRVQASSVYHVVKPFADRMMFSSVTPAPGLVKFLKDEAPPVAPANSKEMKSFLKRVPFAERGIGLVTVANDDEHAVAVADRLSKANRKEAQKNGTEFKKHHASIAKARVGLRPTQK